MRGEFYSVNSYLNHMLLSYRCFFGVYFSQSAISVHFTSDTFFWTFACHVITHHENHSDQSGLRISSLYYWLCFVTKHLHIISWQWSLFQWRKKTESECGFDNMLLSFHVQKKTKDAFWIHSSLFCLTHTHTHTYTRGSECLDTPTVRWHADKVFLMHRV